MTHRSAPPWSSSPPHDVCNKHRGSGPCFFSSHPTHTMTKKPLPLLTQADQLIGLCPSKEKVSACTCTLKNTHGWTSVTESDWPAHMQAIATLQDPENHELSFEEFHPNGTRYDSPQAPVALGFFPTNRSTVFECQRCKQCALRYTEFGGYYVDPRARLLDPQLIIQAPK